LAWPTSRITRIGLLLFQLATTAAGNAGDQWQVKWLQ